MSPENENKILMSKHFFNFHWGKYKIVIKIWISWKNQPCGLTWNKKKKRKRTNFLNLCHLNCSALYGSTSSFLIHDCYVCNWVVLFQSYQNFQLSWTLGISALSFFFFQRCFLLRHQTERQDWKRRPPNKQDSILCNFFHYSFLHSFDIF